MCEAAGVSRYGRPPFSIAQAPIAGEDKVHASLDSFLTCHGDRCPPAIVKSEYNVERGSVNKVVENAAFLVVLHQFYKFKFSLLGQTGKFIVLFSL